MVDVHFFTELPDDLIGKVGGIGVIQVAGNLDDGGIGMGGNRQRLGQFQQRIAPGNADAVPILNTIGEEPGRRRRHGPDIFPFIGGGGGENQYIF